MYMQILFIKKVSKILDKYLLYDILNNEVRKKGLISLLNSLDFRSYENFLLNPPF